MMLLDPLAFVLPELPKDLDVPIDLPAAAGMVEVAVPGQLLQPREDAREEERDLEGLGIRQARRADLKLVKI